MTEPISEPLGRPGVDPVLPASGDSGVVGAVGQVAGSAPEVGVPCLTYSRIVGYMMPLENWNQGKQQEFRDRANYTLGPETINRL